MADVKPRNVVDSSRVDCTAVVSTEHVKLKVMFTILLTERRRVLISLF